MTELAFVMARTQNRFFLELVEAIRDELDQLGIRSAVHLDGFPSPRSGLVYVLVPPHEYYALRSTVDPPSPQLLKRSIFLCGEQPESHFFEQDVQLAADAGAVFDISTQAVGEWRRRGVAAVEFPLGYIRRWDRSSSTHQRDIDIAFLGSRSERRTRLLAGYAGSLWRWRCHLLLSDNSRPNYRAGPDFMTGNEKRELLARTRVLLNLHVDERPYCETLRIVEAVMCGAVVVSEHAGDTSPLVPGVDFLSSSPENLVLLAQQFLENDEERAAFAERAITRLREELPLRRSVERLAAVAEDVDHSAPVPSVEPVHVREDQEPVFAFPNPTGATADPDAAVMRRAIKQLKLDLISQHRRFDELDTRLSPDRRRDVSLAVVTPAYRGARPRVSIVISLYDYENHIEAALESVAWSSFRSFEVIVVDDASTDQSLARASRWAERNAEIPALILRHSINRGLPRARNTGVDFARGEFVFILDADNEVYPHCLARLVDALEGDPTAMFAYGMADRFDSSGALGLLSVGGWEPERLRAGNYIDAMAMLRTRTLVSLGGYTTDGRLHGWEDYDLWCSMAERDWRGHAVREVLGRYRVSAGSMLGSVTSLSATDAYVALIERHPALMTGVVPPL